MRDYIRRHRESNATAADLWRALERHMGEAGQAVADVVRPWIEREGFPLLRVRRERRAGAGGVLVLSQERFSAHGPSAARRATPWPIPIVFKLGVGEKAKAKAKTKTERSLLSAQRARVPLPRGVRFVYANADEGGFFRPLHEDALWRELTAHATELSAVERLGLCTHGWALVHAGYAPLTSFLDLVPALAGETDPDVLSALRGPLFHMLDSIAPAASPKAEPQLRAFIARVFSPSFERLGARKRRGEDEHDSLLRAELLGLIALIAEDAEAVTAAEKQLVSYLRRPGSLEPNLAGPVVVVGARRGDLARHARYLAESVRASTPQEQRRFRMALAEFRERACIDATLQLCLDARIPTQDVALLLSRLLENPAARERTFEFLRRHWRALEQRMPAALTSRVIDATPLLGTEAHRRALHDFFAKHPVPAAERALRQADERFRLDAALRERAAPMSPSLAVAQRRAELNAWRRCAIVLAMRVRVSSALWLALIASSGCADSCSCRHEEDAASPESQALTAGQAAPAAAKPKGGQAGTAAPSPNRAAWVPAPDSELTQRLRAAQTSIERDQVFDKPADPASLERVLGDKLGALKADDKPASTTRSSDKTDLVVAARNYRGGTTNVRVKITDTAELPNARRVVSNRLTLIGNQAAGDERGSFVRGYPTVLGHFDEQKISRVSALVGGRYLVQVMVQGAEHPDDAVRYLGQLDWSRLAPKQGKVPKPEAAPTATP